MEAIEFKTRIKNGMIRIPHKFEYGTGTLVKVIIMSEKNTNKPTDIIDKLLADPIQIENFTPLSRNEIYERI